MYSLIETNSPLFVLPMNTFFIFKCWAKLHQLLFFNLFLQLGCKIAGQVAFALTSLCDFLQFLVLL